jgi:hypothetical protein
MPDSVRWQYSAERLESQLYRPGLSRSNCVLLSEPRPNYHSIKTDRILTRHERPWEMQVHAKSLAQLGD